MKWFRPFHSYERNGIMNWGVSANWTRMVFPLVFMIYSAYMMQPVLHGSVYIKQYNMFQYEAIYSKMNTNRPPPAFQTITRVA